MRAQADQETILVADDDPTIRKNLALLLRNEGHDAREAANGREALSALEGGGIALVLLDLKMPEVDGMRVLREHRSRIVETPVIVITAFGGSSAAIEAMKLGAYDYITKPFDLDEVLFTVRRALEQRSLTAQVRALQLESLSHEEHAADEELIGETPAMLRVFKLIGRVAETTEAVLVLGESGTGKELVASAIHRNSNRAAGPFIKVNCAALSPTLLESELFGHERGAFTGAVARRAGRFEQAHEGTLFLDEIGDLDVGLQAKLLRVLQTGQFERVGGNDTLHCDVRVVAATHRDLSQMIHDGRFREDLLYRLNVVTVELPPLASRRDDIHLLTQHFISRLQHKYGWSHLALSPEAAEWIMAQPWPGNIRQLQNALTRAAMLAGGRVIMLDDLHTLAVSAQGIVEVKRSTDIPGSMLRDILEQTERRTILEALVKAGWNRTRTAEQLGISRRQLFDKIRYYRLEP